MNPKAQQFKKRQQKELSFQTESNTQQLGQFQQIFQALATRLFSLDQEVQSLKNKLGRTEATARYSDYRSNALMNLLKGSGTYSDSQFYGEIERLQVVDFEANSAAEDRAKNLSTVTDQPASNGMHAIFSVKLFKNGEELVQERIVRSKLVLGNEADLKQMLPGVNDALVGMNVGDSKRVPMVLMDSTDEAEIALLGLRQDPPQETEQQSEGQQ